jgi:hypothetical protein
MFTIKLYRDDWRVDISEAESFTVLHYDGEQVGPAHAELTIHRSDIKSERVDIYPVGPEDGQPDGAPPRYSKAIIENRFGKTTEIIEYFAFPLPSRRAVKAAA